MKINGVRVLLLARPISDISEQYENSIVEAHRTAHRTHRTPTVPRGGRRNLPVPAPDDPPRETAGSQSEHSHQSSFNRRYACSTSMHRVHSRWIMPGADARQHENTRTVVYMPDARARPEKPMAMPAADMPAATHACHGERMSPGAARTGMSVPTAFVLSDITALSRHGMLMITTAVWPCARGMRIRPSVLKALRREYMRGPRSTARVRSG